MEPACCISKGSTWTQRRPPDTKFWSFEDDSQGRRLLRGLADEELMLLGEIINQRWSVGVQQRPLIISRVLSPTRTAPRCRTPDAGRQRCCSASTLPLFASVDSEPLGWGENKFVALWRSRLADQWRGGGRSRWRRRRGLRKRKEGFYVTEWKIQAETGTCLSYFYTLAPLPLPPRSSSSVSCPCPAFLLFKSSLFWVKWWSRNGPWANNKYVFNIWFSFPNWFDNNRIKVMPLDNWHACVFYSQRTSWPLQNKTYCTRDSC